MDLREKKTKRSIKNAFLQLRRKKPLERITVMELTALAEIGKATFYLHYRDIYDLSDQMQEEVLQNILLSITHPEYCLSESREFTKELFYAFHAEESLLETLFSGAQSSVLPDRIEAELLEFIRKRNPNMDKKTEMRISYSIHGGHAVYQKYYKSRELNEIVDLVSEASAAILGE